MEHIGKQLREQREALGYSLETMSAKTKLSLEQLKAIEAGDIQYFKDDLSYLSYFVRYYATALNVDYNELKGELQHTIHDYTETISLEQIRKKEEISSTIQERVERTSKKHAPLNKAKKATSKFDVASIGLLVLVVAICGFLLILLGKYVIPGATQKKPETPIVEKPKPETPDKDKEPDEKPEDPATTPEEKTLEIKVVEPTVIHILNWTEGQEIEVGIDVKVATSINYYEDGIQTELSPGTPADGVYRNTVASAKVTAKEQSELLFGLGYWSGNDLLINGAPVELAPAIRDLKGNGTVHVLFVKGE